MSNIYLDNAKLGKNEWWRYLLTLLAPLITILLVNMMLRQVLPSFKALFPEGEFGKSLGTFVLVFSIFGLALLAFMIVAPKLHHRPMMSFINTGIKFEWTPYFLGFGIWGGLLSISELVLDASALGSFIQNFNTLNFLILFASGLVAIGVQSFFEEVIIRGYWLQGLRLRIKITLWLVVVNALLFGVLHVGYGIESFLSSWAFGIALAVIVLLQNRIEFVSGVHNANNLFLSLVFLDLTDAVNEKFSWTINWINLSMHLIALTVLVLLAYKYFRK